MPRPRREFSGPVRRAAYERSNGICECHLIPHVFKVFCGRPLGEGNTFYEHIICDGIGGEPTLENCACLTKTCFNYKTNSYDKRTVAKSNRVRSKSIRANTLAYAPLAGTRRSGISKPFRGPPIDRSSGQPLGRR